MVYSTVLYRTVLVECVTGHIKFWFIWPLDAFSMLCCIAEELECTALYYSRGRCYYYHNVGRPMKLSRSSFSRPSLPVTFLFLYLASPSYTTNIQGNIHLYQAVSQLINTSLHITAYYTALQSPFWGLTYWLNHPVSPGQVGGDPCVVEKRLPQWKTSLFVASALANPIVTYGWIGAIPGGREASTLWMDVQYYSHTLFSYQQKESTEFDQSTDLCLKNLILFRCNQTCTLFWQQGLESVGVEGMYSCIHSSEHTILRNTIMVT